MADHPINGLMQTAMENIKEMVDVNTIVGEPVQTPDGSVIIPISRVGFGFAAGGSEFTAESQNQSGGMSTHRTDAHNANVQLPFGGGSGGGVSITPIAFLVVGGTEGVKIVPLDNQTHIWERLIESAPQWVDKVRSMFQGGTQQAGMMQTGAMQTGMTQNAMQAGTIPGGTMQAGAAGISHTGATGGTTSERKANTPPVPIAPDPKPGVQ